MADNTLAEKIDALIAKKIPFAFYYSPGEEDPTLVIQTEGPLFRAESYEDLNGIEGFVFAPFDIRPHTPLVVIRSDRLLKGISVITACNTDDMSSPEFSTKEEKRFPPPEMSKTEYRQLAAPLIRMIQDGEFEKVVLSRTLCVDMPEGRSCGEMLLKLKEKVNDAFICLVHLPGIGTWMGATPELLLRKHNDRFHTVSLAGTLPVGDSNGVFNWTAKEIREQEIVTEFIETQLKTFGIDGYEKSGPFTSFAANVAHLKTEIGFPCEKVETELGRFISTLHPTSAVCGNSREKARGYILAKERHDREYYCGFLGEWNLAGRLNLYVNIRCMKILGNKACLYVGGGITADSIVDSEWDETNHKAKTLLSILM